MNKDEYIQKLERRIHNQRAQLRWWEKMFSTHVKSHWRRACYERARRIRDFALKVARKP